MRKSKKLFVDIIVTPVFQVICGVVIVLLIREILSLCDLISIQYDRVTLLTFILSIISLYLTSNIIIYCLKFPTRLIYLLPIPINFISYSLMSMFLLITRENYSRLDLVIFIGVSCILQTFSVYFFIRNRKYIMLYVGNGREISLINKNNLRLIKGSPEKIKLYFNRCQDFLDGIIVDFSIPINDDMAQSVSLMAMNGIKIYDICEVYERIDGYVPLSSYSQIASGWRVSYDVYSDIKKLLDVIFSLIFFPLIVCILLIAAIMIKLDSSGPVLFVQNRVGHKGKIFRIYKLRTMQNFSSNGPISPTVIDDCRVTRVGKYLRKYRFDELPQIINILMGHMSWIGPRPEALDFHDRYVSIIPFFQFRNVVKPGITGWAAVNQGHVFDNRDVSLKLNYDFYYIKNMSFYLDLLILLKTIKVIVTAWGAK